MIYSNTYEQDLLTAQKNIRNIEKLNNTKVLITGATGMIGSALVDIIMNKNLYDNDKVQVYAAARKEGCNGPLQIHQPAAEEHS